MTGFSRSAGTSPSDRSSQTTPTTRREPRLTRTNWPGSGGRAALRRPVVQGAAQRQRQQHLDRRRRRAGGGLRRGIDPRDRARHYFGHVGRRSTEYIINLNASLLYENTAKC